MLGIFCHALTFLSHLTKALTISVEGDETSLITEIFHFEEVPSDSKCSGKFERLLKNEAVTKIVIVAVESDKETSEANTSGSVDICDCVACKIKQKKGSAKDQVQLQRAMFEIVLLNFHLQLNFLSRKSGKRLNI